MRRECHVGKSTYARTARLRFSSATRGRLGCCWGGCTGAEVESSIAGGINEGAVGRASSAEKVDKAQLGFTPGQSGSSWRLGSTLAWRTGRPKGTGVSDTSGTGSRSAEAEVEEKVQTRSSKRFSITHRFGRGPAFWQNCLFFSLQLGFLSPPLFTLLGTCSISTETYWTCFDQTLQFFQRVLSRLLDSSQGWQNCTYIELSTLRGLSN